MAHERKLRCFCSSTQSHQLGSAHHRGSPRSLLSLQNCLVALTRSSLFRVQTLERCINTSGSTVSHINQVSSDLRFWRCFLAAIASNRREAYWVKAGLARSAVVYLWRRLASRVLWAGAHGSLTVNRDRISLDCWEPGAIARLLIQCVRSPQKLGVYASRAGLCGAVLFPLAPSPRHTRGAITITALLIVALRQPRNWRLNQSGYIHPHATHY